MIQEIENFIIAVPIPIWFAIGGAIGWCIGRLIKKSVKPEPIGTLYKIVHSDGSAELLLELKDQDTLKNLDFSLSAVFDVKIKYEN